MRFSRRALAILDAAKADGLTGYYLRRAETDAAHFARQDRASAIFSDHAAAAVHFAYAEQMEAESRETEYARADAAEEYDDSDEE